MRSRLLGSFLFVLIFWWLALSFWWFTAPPQEALHRLTSAAALLPWASHLPALKPTVFDFWRIQADTVDVWTGPLILVALLAALIGAGVVWMVAHKLNRHRDERISASETYRGVGITLGVLPAPAVAERAEVEFTASTKELRNLLDQLSPGEFGVLEALLEMLAASGLDHVEQVLEEIERALSLPNPGLACIVETACAIGDTARERARLISSLPAWWELPPERRYGMLLAVKFRGQELKWVPEMTGLPEASRLARDLLVALDAPKIDTSEWKRKGPFYLIDGDAQSHQAGEDPPIEERALAPAEPHERAASGNAANPPPAPRRAPPAESTNAAQGVPPKKPVGLLDIFCRELPHLPLRIRGISATKKVVPLGWKKRGRLYLIEKSLVETLWHKLPQALKEQFNEAPAGPRSPVTRALLDVLHLEGWLVTKNGLDELSATEALWVVKAGKLDFKGVIVLSKLPDTLMDQLPTEDSPFDMTILRPLFFASKNPEREHNPGDALDRRELAGNLEEELASAGSAARMDLDFVVGRLLRPAPSATSQADGAQRPQPEKKV